MLRNAASGPPARSSKLSAGFCFLEVKLFVSKRVKCVAASVPNPTLLLLLLMKEAVVDNSQSVDSLLSAETVSNLLFEGLYFAACRLREPCPADVVSGRHHLTEEPDLLDVD